MRVQPVVVAGLLLACAPPPGPPVRVTIPRGASVRAIADTLAAHRLVRSARWFRTWVGLRGMDRALKAGTYDLPTGLPVGVVARRLATGQPATFTFTVPEGAMFDEIVAQADRAGVDADSLRAAVRDSALRRLVHTQLPTLEGYLYPTTYHVRVGATARELVTQMVEEFVAQWDDAWDDRLRALGMTRDDLVTLASIVEGEVRHPADRHYVASVYFNRLNAGWRLQADPTVIYALGRRRRLFERDYAFRSPYNTYLIDGLPPGPVGQPSAATIAATLFPARTDFFFFVARDDGYHVFTRTLREHLQAIRDIRSGG